MTQAAERERQKSGGSAQKSAARLAAVQALYQIDHSATSFPTPSARGVFAFPAGRQF